MALSGTISTTWKGYTYKIIWSATQSVVNNTSTITCTHELVCDWSLDISSRENTCTVDGTKVIFKSSGIDTDGDKTFTLGTTTHAVSHNSDGTKSCDISGTFNMNATISGTKKYKMTASDTVTLDTIPRKSTLTVADGTLGTAQTLTINEMASEFYHKLTYSCGSASGYILGSDSTTSDVLSKSWTPPISLANQNTTGKSVSIVFTLHTYTSSSGTLIGSNTYTETFVIPSSVGPGVPTISVSDSTGYLSTYGGYVQNKSVAKVTTSASTTNSQGATIASYVIYLNGTKCSSTTFTPSTTGTNTIKVVATDTRGYSSSNEKIISVLPYSKPTISATPTKSGSTLTLSYQLTYSSLNNKNKVNIDVYSSPSLVANSTIISDISDSTATSDIITISGNHPITIDEDTTYSNVYVKVTDALGEYNTSTKSTVWGSERIFNVHPSGTGVCFGKKASSENLFECKWDANFLGNLSVQGKTLVDAGMLIDMIYPVGSIYMSVNNVSPGSFLGGTWERLEDKFLLGASDTYPAGTEGGKAKVTLTTDQMPSHTHTISSSGDHTHTGYYRDDISSTDGTKQVLCTSTNSNVAGDTTGNATTSSGAHTHTPASTGGGEAHENMPPYLAVYMWQRTA